MPPPKALSHEALKLIAARFSVLAEPMRLRLIHELFDGEKNVTELVGATGGTQANVSRHLQVLSGAHFLSRRRQGMQVYYKIADPNVAKICELVCGSLERSLAREVMKLS